MEARNKALVKSTGMGGLALRERTASSHIPFLRHVHDQVVTTKDGVLCVFLALDGFCHQTADIETINVLLDARNTAMMALRDSRFAVYSTLIRSKLDVRLGRLFDNDFCGELDRRYQENLTKKALFGNDLVLTVMRRGFQGDVGRADRLFGALARGLGLRSADDEREQAIEEVLEVAQQMEAAMRSHGVRILSVVEREDGLYSEPAEFLFRLVNGGRAQSVRLPRMGLDECLASSQIMFGENAIELRAPDGERRFGAMVSLHEYPPATAAGMLDRLLELPQELVISQSFQMVDRAEANDRMNKVARQVASSDARGTDLEVDLEQGRSDLMTGVSVFGVHHLSVLCLASDLKGLNRSVADVSGRLSDMGMIAVREAMAAEATFWAQLPSNFGYACRTGMISSRNFAGMASQHNFPLGKRSGNHWGEALACLETTSRTPYYFNFHRRDVGHTAVFGPTGSGKTVLLTFLMAQAQGVRYGKAGRRARGVFFDKDHGAEIFVRAMGGKYLTFEPGVSSGLDPLMMANTAENCAALVRILSFMVRPRDGSRLSAGDEAAISHSVHEIMALAPSERQWAMFLSLFGGRREHDAEGISARLEAWLDRSAKGWLFNNGEDHIDWDTGVVGFDMTKLLDEPEIRTAAMLYIFHRMDELLTGAPLVVMLDEGWRLLDDPVFGGFIRDKLKVYRKLNALLVFATQSVADVVNSPLKATIREQTSTVIYYPNPKADEASHMGEFKLSRREFDWIAKTDPSSRQFLLKHDNDSVIARLDLSAARDLVSVLSGGAETNEEVAVLREQLGDDPKEWLPVFLARRPAP